MSGKGVDRACPVVLVNLVKPRNALRMVLWSRLPVLSVLSREGMSASHAG